MLFQYQFLDQLCTMSLRLLTLLITLSSLNQMSSSCETNFEGFGVYVGTPSHMKDTNASFVQKVLDQLYFDLGIRHFRINYLSDFSPTLNQYTLKCTSSPSCEWTWDVILSLLSNTTRYKDNLTFIASVWSPPPYMKNQLFSTLLQEFEPDYYYFLKNVTELIRSQYGITIQHVSAVNEPDNIFATWEHCSMSPDQLCRMIKAYDDPLTSFCPEVSHYWLTEFYMAYTSPHGYSCFDACDIVATHGYNLNLYPSSPYFGLASYDVIPHPSKWVNRRIWMTEVSSTYPSPEVTQMEEGFTLARSIINFLGTTCVERFYFWLAYTEYPSGESLIWGDSLVLPKKYFIYRHFTQGRNSVGNNATVISCDDVNLIPHPGTCVVFRGTESNLKMAVFLNRDILNITVNAQCTEKFCCTTDKFDYKCQRENVTTLPARSVCSCAGLVLN